MNRLGNATSPYLQQHADNPVDWWPWSPEAFDEALRRDVPVFLSVGYSACHWCHVMARESFSDPALAEYLNAHFVSIKVDREERPDVDDVYMRATVAMTRRGGWPMSVFLDHDRRPFYAGTYFPPSARPGMPSFRDVLVAVSDAWRDRRRDVELTAAELLSHLQADRSQAGSALSEAAADAAVARIADIFDPRFGGFGGAPKFPQATTLGFLLRHHARTGEEQSLAMAATTLRHMALGGIYDQLGGGFARYSVDARWTVPHFEKMLYDNALLLRIYTQWWLIDNNPLARRVVEETAEFLLTELKTAGGAFAAALDADSDGREGAFYVWSAEEVRSLGGDIRLLGVTESGTFEAGLSVLQLTGEPGADWPAVRRRMRQARARRNPPAIDGKVVLSWNAWTVSALAEAGAVLDRADWVQAAETAARYLLEVHRDGEVLRRVSRDGHAGAARAVLEDAAALASCLFTLHGVTGRWLDEALWAAGLLREEFLRGGLRDTSASDLPQVPPGTSDLPTPSGVSQAAEVMLTVAAVTGDAGARQVCLDLLAGVLDEREPLFCGHAWSVGEAVLDGPREVALLADPGSALHRAVMGAGRPGAVIAFDGPLLHGRTRIGGQDTAYVCRDSVCLQPATDVAVVTEQLRIE